MKYLMILTALFLVQASNAWAVSASSYNLQVDVNSVFVSDEGEMAIYNAPEEVQQCWNFELQLMNNTPDCLIIMESFMKAYRSIKNPSENSEITNAAYVHILETRDNGDCECKQE